jgi:hypothetical protein
LAAAESVATCRAAFRTMVAGEPFLELMIADTLVMLER